MASAQIGSSLSATRERYAHLIVEYCRTLLDFAEWEFQNLASKQTFEIAGVSLRFGCSSPDYLRLCERAYPTASASEDEDLRPVTLAILDHASLPALPFWPGASPGMGNVALALAEQGLRGAYDPDHRIWYVYDPDRALAVQVMPSFDSRPAWEGSFPARLLIHWSARSEDRGMIHAGTLGHAREGVFLAGAGGAGKSGTTLSGILNGLESAGDDYVAVRFAHGRIETQPVLRLMKQDEAGLRRLGLKSVAFEGPNWQGKFEFDFDSLRPGARAGRLAMKAILIPQISGAARSSFRPASGREAMMSLAPSSLYQLYGTWKEDFGLLASIARALPAYHLALSENPAEIADAIRNFIGGNAS
ncbi:MAG: serine kinase [Hyphomicrobium sp.]|uniref:serine kinase n=1 Tax=Hyphomicrobium sp. TaxID=82 RepID=UPI0039E657E7